MFLRLRGIMYHRWGSSILALALYRAMCLHLISSQEFTFYFILFENISLKSFQHPSSLYAEPHPIVWVWESQPIHSNIILLPRMSTVQILPLFVCSWKLQQETPIGKIKKFHRRKSFQHILIWPNNGTWRLENRQRNGIYWKMKTVANNKSLYCG